MRNFVLVDYAALLLRVALALMFFAHAWLKIKVFTPAGSVKYFESLGVPGFFAYLTMAAEIAGGTLLLLGIETRWVALLLVPLIAGTIVLVHGKNGWLFSNKDGGWEYPAFWIVGLLVLAALGDGAVALGPALGLSQDPFADTGQQPQSASGGLPLRSRIHIGDGTRLGGLP